MIRLGKTFGNLMVDVVATNEKLRARVRRIVGARDRGAGRSASTRRSHAAGGDAKVAIVSLLAGVDAEAARRAARSRRGGVVRRALEP